MPRDEVPVSPDEVPEEARNYLAAVQAHRTHPFVARHFYQVTWLTWGEPDRKPVSFFALEFRDGTDAALVWQDGAGHWGAGGWVRVAHADADITCPPSPVSLAYFQGAQAHPSLPEALTRLAATKPPG